MEDCICYGFKGTETWTQKDSNTPTTSITNGELTITPKSNVWSISNELRWTKPDGEWVVEFDAKLTGGTGLAFGVQGNKATIRYGYMVGLERSGGGNIKACQSSSNDSTSLLAIGTSTDYNHYKIIAHNDTTQIFFNNVLKQTLEDNDWLTGECWIFIGGWYADAKGWFKNLRIKPYQAE